MHRGLRFALASSILFASLNASAAEPRNRPVRIDPRSLATAESVVWVAAHPDDEVIVAPLLAEICMAGGRRCTLLVLTRGEHGECLLPGGCAPSLASVRSAEAAASSAMFGADLVLLSLPDSGGGAEWQLASGGRAPLVRTLATYIAATGANVVLTFDPRHGTTCHGDHRAVGSLVAEAMTMLENAPTLYFVETRIEIDPAAPAFTFGPALPAGSAERSDANVLLAGLGTSGWDVLLDTMRVHRSQFDEAWLAAAEAVLPENRAVWFATAQAALSVPAPPCK